MSDVGFGWNLYGFFIAAVIWLAVYFAWAWREAERDRDRARARRDDGR